MNSWRTSEKESRGRNHCEPLHCTLSSVFVLAVWLWMNSFWSLTTHHLSALVLNTENEIFMWGCERTAATSQNINEYTHQQIYNKPLTSRYEIEIDVLQWRMKCNCSTVCQFSFLKKHSPKANYIFQHALLSAKPLKTQTKPWKNI